MYIKKEIKSRKILGSIINSEGKLKYYLYPQLTLNTIQKEPSTNILVLGETGVGKSTWINSLLNYIENIEIGENIRYLHLTRIILFPFVTTNILMMT